MKSQKLQELINKKNNPRGIDRESAPNPFPKDVPKDVPKKDEHQKDSQNKNPARSLNTNNQGEENENENENEIKTILIGTVCTDGKATMQYMSSVLSTKDYLLAKGYHLNWCFTSNKYDPMASKNIIFTNFIADKNAKYLLLVNPDCQWEPAVVHHMIELAENQEKSCKVNSNELCEKRGLILAACPAEGYKWNMLKQRLDQAKEKNEKFSIESIDELTLILTDYNIDSNGATVDSGKLLTVNHSELGFALFKREAVEKFLSHENVSKLKYSDDTGEMNENTPIYALFNNHNIKSLKTPDYAFCELWRSCGLSINIDLSVVVFKESKIYNAGKLGEALIYVGKAKTKN